MNFTLQMRNLNYCVAFSSVHKVLSMVRHHGVREWLKHYDDVLRDKYACGLIKLISK